MMRPGLRLRAGPLLAALLAVSLPASGAPHVVESAPSILNLVLPRIEEACGARFEPRPVASEVSDLVARRIAAQDVLPELERQYPGVNEGQMRFLVRTHATSLARSCLARYSLSEDRIVLVRETFDAQRKALGIGGENAWHLLASTLAHECVHALDDQRFDLAKLYRGAPDTEALRARAMLVEGRAIVFGGRVAKALDVPPSIRDMLPGGREPGNLRAWTIRLTSEYGARFVEALLERGGTELADRAMREPPAVTHFVCQPERWPDGTLDPAPEKLLASLGLAGKTSPVSELELRARWAASDGPATAERLFAAYRGGAQAIVAQTNVAALAFADEASATRYAERSRSEAEVVHEGGTLVLRVTGIGAADVLEELLARRRR